MKILDNVFSFEVENSLSGVKWVQSGTGWLVVGESKTIKSRFRSKSEHSLDTKGRLNLPSRFRDVLAQYGSNMLILVPWKKHLRVYPLSEWEMMEDRLIDQIKEQPELRGFIRMLLSGATDCKTDKQGRLLLPVSLRTEIKMGKDVILTGMRDWIEIWDTDIWNSEMKTTRETFDTLDEGLAKLGIL